MSVEIRKAAQAASDAVSAVVKDIRLKTQAGGMPTLSRTEAARVAAQDVVEQHSYDTAKIACEKAREAIAKARSQVRVAKAM